MVQAILEGRKTMTRRVVPLKDHSLEFFGSQIGDPKRNGTLGFGNDNLIFELIKPKYQVGDVLWVREAWRLTGWNFNLGRMTIEFADGLINICPAYDPNEDSMWLLDQVEALESKGIIESSTSEPDAFIFTDKNHPWKPSIHMPKVAARIWLRITNIKVERLHDISEESIKAEGVQISVNAETGGVCFVISSPNRAWEFFEREGENTSYKYFFAFWAELWVSINGRESWETNPWVWAISFEVLSTTGKPKNL